jgi:hypothetical protein
VPFDGETYEREVDGQPLKQQLAAVREFLLARGGWWMLARLADELGFPEASISARLRDLRKGKFGGFTVKRRRCQDFRAYEYMLLPRGVQLGQNTIAFTNPQGTP